MAKLRRELSTPATTHWYWSLGPRWKNSSYKCDCNGDLFAIRIPIIKKGSQTKAIHRCTRCAKYYSTISRITDYTLTIEGWKRNDRP